MHEVRASIRDLLSPTRTERRPRSMRNLRTCPIRGFQGSTVPYHAAGGGVIWSPRRTLYWELMQRSFPWSVMILKTVRRYPESLENVGRAKVRRREPPVAVFLLRHESHNEFL